MKTPIRVPKAGTEVVEKESNGEKAGGVSVTKCNTVDKSAPLKTCECSGGWTCHTTLGLVVSNKDTVSRPHVVGSITSEGHGSIEISVVIRATCFDWTKPGMAGELVVGIETKTVGDGETSTCGLGATCGHWNSLDANVEVPLDGCRPVSGDTGETDETGWAKTIDCKKDSAKILSGKHTVLLVTES